ncbi:MAG TPA: GNAT family N-acetyltransferase [Bdellovibrionota bacterium]|nr:GNAT family N-acetyltransferase [Bdellovibrionota bacterium]
MNIEIKFDLNEVDWDTLADVFERAPLGKRDPEKLRRAFESSYLTCIIMVHGKPVAAGRALSDGEYYANIYDVVVLPEFQGSGLGKLIVQNLLGRLENKFILLTTTIGKENFYRKFGFRKHRTAMAIYPPSKNEQAQLYLETDSEARQVSAEPIPFNTQFSKA